MQTNITKPLQIAIFTLLLSLGFSASCFAQTSTTDADATKATRTEIKRVDLDGSKNMEVISSIVEIKPGQSSPKHLHHGIEAGYILQGAMIKVGDKPAVMLPTGTAVFNLREAIHGGFTVVGEQSLKIFAVHIVEKDKPLYDLQ